MAAPSPHVDDRVMRPSPISVIVTAALAATTLAACGDDETGTASTVTPAATVERYLAQAGEEPGFTPVGAPETMVGADQRAAALGLPAQDAQRLIRDGFESYTRGNLEASDAGGASEVQVFKDAAGAKSWMALEQSTAEIRRFGGRGRIERFSIPGVPGGRGYVSAEKGSDLPVGTVNWVQGRCLLGLSNQGPDVRRDDLMAGAQAIYRRTGGKCP